MHSLLNKTFRSVSLFSSARWLSGFFLCLCFLTSPLAGAATERNLLVLGDSLSAGYGIDEADGWVNLLRQKLDTQEIPLTVINGSISGDTTAGGLARLPRLLEQYQPEIVILELGGNDGLRGYPIPQMRENLASMIAMSREQGAEVLLVGMKIPPNYGPRYTRLFEQTYQDLREETSVALVPFMLVDVALHPEMMQKDQIHPTAAGQPPILDTIWKSLAPLLND